jgi:hypothetical protein
VRRTSIRVLVTVAVGATIAGLFVLRLLATHGYHSMSVAWIEYVAIVALAAFIFWLGWTVRSYQRGKRPNLDPLRAARTFVLAKSGAFTGAILNGRYLAAVLEVVHDLDVESQRRRAISALVAVACSLILTVASLLAERFCRLPPVDGDTRGGSSGTTDRPRPGDAVQARTAHVAGTQSGSL